MQDKQNVTLGEIMRAQRREAIKAAAMFMAIVLYGAVLIYTGVHNFNLISRTVAPDQQLFAIVALLCLEGAAIFLPIAVHFWLAPGPQRMVGYLLYAAEFTVIIVNTIVDAIFNRAESMPDWLRMYATFFLPATPIIIGVGIAFIFLLDPSKKIHDARMAAEAAKHDMMAVSMRQQADAPEVGEFIDGQAKASVRQIVGMDKDAPQLPAPSRKSRLARRFTRPRTEVVVIGRNGNGNSDPDKAKRKSG